MPIRFYSSVPQFTVPDVVQTAEWYRDKLGFEIVAYFAEGPAFAIVRRDSAEFFFSRADGSPVRTGRAKFALDAYVRISGVDELYENMRAKGVEILEEPEDREYNQREVTVKDLNGLVICFGQAIDEGA